MQINFYKYQGTGNDFVILDNRDGRFNKTTAPQIAFLCNRRFGIGADGLMMLNQHPDYDFEMKYYNADGGISTMCGNGGRCLVMFAYHKGIVNTTYHFLAADGPHEASIDNHNIVKLKMKDVSHIERLHGDFLLDTGSPHYIKMVNSVADFDVFHKGREIRNSAPFVQEGINVNFVEQKEDDHIIVRTYERGVEDETFSCGTGVTASALVCYHNEYGFNDVEVSTKGGKLSVEFDRTVNGTYNNVWLCGPAIKVFEGTMLIPD